jgi:hypothetical protein
MTRRLNRVAVPDVVAASTMPDTVTEIVLTIISLAAFLDPSLLAVLATDLEDLLQTRDGVQIQDSSGAVILIRP